MSILGGDGCRTGVERGSGLFAAAIDFRCHHVPWWATSSTRSTLVILLSVGWSRQMDASRSGEIQKTIGHSFRNHLSRTT
jgi:hypothetical protein